MVNNWREVPLAVTPRRVFTDLCREVGILTILWSACWQSLGPNSRGDKANQWSLNLQRKAGRLLVCYPGAFLPAWCRGSAGGRGYEKGGATGAPTFQVTWWGVQVHPVNLVLIHWQKQSGETRMEIDHLPHHMTWQQDFSTESTQYYTVLMELLDRSLIIIIGNMSTYEQQIQEFLNIVMIRYIFIGTTPTTPNYFCCFTSRFNTVFPRQSSVKPV